MTDREARDYGRRAYAHYRKALVEAYPGLEDSMTEDYDQIQPRGRKVWDAMGAWVAEQVDEGVELERMDTECAIMRGKIW